MSILIKGSIEMPKSCDHCWAIDDYSDYPRCLITGDQKGYIFQSDKERMDSCPLVNIPPHGNLIDRDTLISNHTIDQYDWSEVIDVEDIRNAPTILEAEEE